MTPPAPGPRHEALLQLLRTAENIWNGSRLFFARWDLGPSQFNILNLLYLEADGYTQVELSRQLIMHKSNVTGLINRLEKRRLVTRSGCAQDRRVYLIKLSAHGKALIRRILPEYYRVAEAVWGDFPISRTRKLMNELRHLDASAESFVTGTVRTPARPASKTTTRPSGNAHE